MKSNSSRGRPLSSDPSFQVLLMNVLTKHSQLISLIQEQEDTRIYYEGLQDKLSQVWLNSQILADIFYADPSKS